MKSFFASRIVSESQYDAARTSGQTQRERLTRQPLGTVQTRESRSLMKLVLEGKANLAGSSAGLVAS